MFNHHIAENLLMGVISLALITPLALPINSVSASAPKWLRIKTSRSQLMLSKPGHSRKIIYYRGKKGLRVRNRGSFSYHHQRYYRVSFKTGRKQRIVYILANQLNTQRPTRHHHKRNHLIIKRTKRNHHRASVKQTKNKSIKAPKMSHETWEVNSKSKPVKNVNRFNKQVRSESFLDVNQDRRTHHQKPLKQNKLLNKIANVRAKQLAGNFSHYYDGKRTYFSKDARRYDINATDITWGENLARVNYGNNPIKIANFMNNGYMNNDAESGWSHRANILSPNYHYVGLGSYHDNQNNTTYQAEDFAG